VKQLRREGLIPGVIYGPGLAGGGTIQVSINRRELERVYNQVGGLNKISVQLTGKTYRVFIKELQVDPVKRTPVHVDLFVSA
jgi:large subunit ribosomal protein L25